MADLTSVQKHQARRNFRDLIVCAWSIATLANLWVNGGWDAWVSVALSWLAVTILFALGRLEKVMGAMARVFLAAQEKETAAESGKTPDLCKCPVHTYGTAHAPCGLKRGHGGVCCVSPSEVVPDA